MPTDETPDIATQEPEQNNQNPDPAPEGPKIPEGVEFPEGVEPDIASSASIEPFITDDNKIDYANLMKSYVHTKKAFGRNKVALPGKDATDEDWNSFYNQIGRPEDVEKYSLNVPEEADEEVVNEFKQKAHEAGLLPKQAQKLFDWYSEFSGKMQEKVSNQQNEKLAEQIQGLKKEWGNGYDKELDIAKNALKQFATAEEIEAMKESGLSKNVQVIKLLNKVGKGLMEDSFKPEAKGTFGMTKDEAESKIEEMYSNPNGAYLNKAHPKHYDAIQKMLKLQQIVDSAQ